MSNVINLMRNNSSKISASHDPIKKNIEILKQKAGMVKMAANVIHQAKNQHQKRASMVSSSEQKKKNNFISIEKTLKNAKGFTIIKKERYKPRSLSSSYRKETFKPELTIRNFKSQEILKLARTNQLEKIQCLTYVILRVHLRYADKNGRTALHFACLHKNFRMAKIFLEHGADPCLKCREGTTPLSIAQAGYGQHWLELLQKYAKSENSLNYTSIKIGSKGGEYEMSDHHVLEGGDLTKSPIWKKIDHNHRNEAQKEADEFMLLVEDKKSGSVKTVPIKQGEGGGKRDKESQKRRRVFRKKLRTRRAGRRIRSKGGEFMKALADTASSAWHGQNQTSRKKDIKASLGRSFDALVRLKP